MDFGSDVDGDGRADLLFTETAGTFAGGLDVDGGPDEPHGAPNVVHVRSIASDEDIWTLTGPGGCHALGAAGRFVPDYDADGVADVLLLDPGCVSGHTASGPDFGPDSSDMSGSLELHSGRDGRVIRAWSRSEGVGTWGDGGVYASLDQDGDGKPEFLVLSGRSTAGSPEVEVFSMQSDVAIARWHPDSETEPLVRPTSGTYLASDLTGDGDPNLVTVEGGESGEILVTVLGQLSSATPTRNAFSFRVPGSSRSYRLDSYYGHGDVDGDGSEDIIIQDYDAERGRSLDARLVAVSLDGRVLWMSPHDTLRGSLVGDGVVDLDGDGRVDFVSAGPGFSTIHIDLSTGFGSAP
ncbi:MAG: hypothetical protein GXP55_10480 [Deltaproteobacteria bacterium]|nr:hypothetical protein [Deltaproteobacteria bacterium]